MTRPRSVGDLQGPAQVPHQVRQITITVEQLPGGRWKFTMPQAPGWAAAASTPGEVTATIRRAFTEAQVAAYCNWRGHIYDDPSAVQHRRHRPAARSRRRCDVYDATEWLMTTDGKWISPKGLRYPERTQVVQRVMAQRVAMGLPPRPDPVSSKFVRPRTRVVSRADWSGALGRVEPGHPVRLAPTSGTEVKERRTA